MNSLRDIWDNNKRLNIPVIKPPEREKRKSENLKLSKEVRKMLGWSRSRNQRDPTS